MSSQSQEQQIPESAPQSVPQNPNVDSSVDAPAQSECGSLNDLVNREIDRDSTISWQEAEARVVTSVFHNLYERGLVPLPAKPTKKQREQSAPTNARKGKQEKPEPRAKRTSDKPPSQQAKAKDQKKQASEPAQSKKQVAQPASGSKPKAPAKTAAAETTSDLKKKEPNQATLLSNFPNEMRRFNQNQRLLWGGVVNRFGNSYKLTHAPGPHDQLQRIKDLRLDHGDPKGTFNSHTLGAAIRAALRTRAVTKAVQEGHFHLAELFGNENAHGYFHALNEHLKGMGWNGKLTLDVIGQHLTAKDQLKRSGEETHTQATFGLLIDLYDHECVSSPDSLDIYLKTHAPRMSTVYVIRNVMTGYAGTAPGYVWFAPKPDRRLVIIGDAVPIEHDYFDWMDVNSHSTTAGWYEDRSYQLSDTVKMMGSIFTFGGSFDPPPVHKILKTPYQYFGVPQSYLQRTKNWLRGYQPMILLDKRMLDNAMARFSNKNQTEFVYASVKLQITQLLRDEHWVKLSTLLDYDNDYVAAVMTDLVMHRTYHQNQVSYKALNPYVERFKSVSANSMFTTKPVSRISPLMQFCIKVGGSVALGVCLFLYYRRRVLLMSLKKLLTGVILPTDQMFGDIVIAPMWEEMARRLVPKNIFTIFQVAYETWRDREIAPWHLQVGRAAMHATCSVLPIWCAVPLHAAWNIYAYWRVIPEIFSGDSWIETAEHHAQVRASSQLMPVVGALLNVATMVSLIKFLTTPVTSYEEYMNALIHDPEVLHYSDGMLAIDCPVVTTNPPATFVDQLLELPTDRRVLVHGEEITSKEQLIELMHTHYDPSVVTLIHHVITFNGCSMWAPQTLKNSTYAALCLAYGRIAKPMPVSPQPHTWSFHTLPPNVQASLILFDCDQGSHNFWQQMWRDHVKETGKWFKYDGFWEHRFDIGEHDHRVKRAVQRIQIMAKADEVLIGKNITKLLPRPIDNISPVVSFVTGPLDYMLKHALLNGRNSYQLHSFSFPYNRGFWGVPIAFKTWKLFWVPALGFTQEDLTMIMQQFLRLDKAALLLSHGDDTLLTYVDNGRIIMMESDLSSCDRSLTKPALTFERDLINHCLQIAGVDDQFFEANRVAYQLNFADRKINEVTVNLDGDAQRPTGCTRTSLMNTVLTAYPILLYHIEHRNADWARVLDYRPESFSYYYKVHGLDAKVKMHVGSVDDLPTGTFLKGVWLHTDCGEVAWTRLPSMALKMFKTLKPLSALTKRYRRESVSLEEARRRYAVMIATSWSTFDLPHGIRQWVDKWADVGAQLPTLPVQGRVESGGVSRYTFSNPRAMAALAKHYRVEQDLFEDWSLKFMSLEPGQGYVHPMWAALGLDY